MPTYYPAKVLLAGEYTVLTGSRALAIPYSGYGAAWQRSATDRSVRPVVAAFVDYLAQRFTSRELDIAALRDDLADGWYLTSSVPEGMGLGSSGVVCAAVFDRYASADSRQLDGQALKAFLGHMESYFHDHSSGADPLVSWLQQPTLLEPDGSFTHPILSDPLEGQLFLLNTGEERRTGPLVARFNQQLIVDDYFQKIVTQEFTRASEQLIDALLQPTIGLAAAFRRVSDFQQEQMRDYIPSPLRDRWQTGEYALKLCGAGGGGFMLGYTHTWETARTALADWPVRILRISKGNKQEYGKQ